MAQPKHNQAFETRTVSRFKRPIDLVHLARQTLGDRNLECEVLRMFERQINLYFERLCAAHDELDMMMALHTLKGASLGVGALGLADMVRAAEHEFGSTGGLDGETVDDLGMAVAEISAYILDLLEA